MPAALPRILVADDQPEIIEALRLLLKSEGYAIESAKSPEAALKILETQDCDLALIDLNFTRDTTSGKEGMDLLAKIRQADPSLPVITMTAWSTVELAVEAMRRGAKDFITKPWDNHRLLATLATQRELATTQRAYRRLLEQTKTADKESIKVRHLIAESAAMRPVLTLLSRVGPSAANVLITGENGTGKGLIARALHELSPRASQPFISVNMGGLAEGVFESELFGHVRGAFTDAKTDRAGRFELADEGTLFLDEIGNIPMKQQAKLLRTVETGEFERVGSSKTHRAQVRLISATNADLPAEVLANRFRQDLLFRLNTIHIHLPPLRERQEDIEALAQHFLQQHRERYRKPLTGFETDALQALHAHHWPGNVRELDHAIERGVLMSSGHLLKVEDLGLRQTSATPSIDEMSLDEVEAHLIRRTLARHSGNARLAAEDLGLSRSAFYRRLEKYHL